MMTLADGGSAPATKAPSQGPPAGAPSGSSRVARWRGSTTEGYHAQP